MVYLIGLLFDMAYDWARTVCIVYIICTACGWRFHLLTASLIWLCYFTATSFADYRSMLDEEEDWT